MSFSFGAAIRPMASLSLPMASLSLPPIILWLLVSSFTGVSASEYSLVVSGATTLHLSPSLIVENSPGSKPGAKVKYETVMINDLPRITHLKKFANSVKVNVSFLYPRARPPNIEFCFHS